MYNMLAALTLLSTALLSAAGGAEALGCMRTICGNDARNFRNQIRPCAGDGNCGDYKSRRRNNQLLEAVELSCNEGTYVYAPFDGEIAYHRPFGGLSKAQCADQGVRIDGRGQWRGYYALISTVKLYRYGGRVRAGDRLGVAGNLECFDDGASAGATRRTQKNYVRVELFRGGKPVDPTHHLVDCMCTGQICETNRVNSLIGMSFKFDSRYNDVRGWELSCPLANGPPPGEANNLDNDGNALWEDNDGTGVERTRAPIIYSPIEGSVIGRVRLDFSGGTYDGCANEGLFIVGTGQWTDYEVRLYNVRFDEEFGVGVKPIAQGQPIGRRLSCPAGGTATAATPDSVFLEVRFQGALVDVSEAISARNCQHRRLGSLFRR